METYPDIMKKKYQADVYRFLSACFCLPQKELFIEENLFGNLKDALKETCEGATHFLSKMEKAFRSSPEEELKVDYARLFVGPYELQVPPYGSVYLDGERCLMGPSTFEVMKFYEEAGLVIDPDLKEPADHIAVELEFMAYLMAREAECLEKLDRTKAMKFRNLSSQFLRRFISPWIFTFCQKVKTATENPFYSALSDCVSLFISNQIKD